MIERHDDGDLDPAFSYGTDLQHKHLSEMTHYSGLQKPPIFMPSVGNFYSGMLVHIPLHADQFTSLVTAEVIYECLANHTDVPTMLAANGFAGRNDMQVFVFSDPGEEQFLVTARLDNLGKGASGAAVQNMNIALGLDETLSII